MKPADKKVWCFVIGNYGNSNIGDETLLKQVIKEVSNSSQVRFSFYVPGRDMDFVRTYHQELIDQITPIYIKDFKKIISSLASCKIIVVGGGGIWSGDTGFFAHFVPFVSILGKLLLKKVIFKSIGLYSTASTLDRFFVNLSIAFSDMCSVRDNESYQMLWKTNRNKKAIRTDDLSLPFIKSIDEGQATLFPNINEYEKVRLLKNQGKFIVGISLKSMKKDPLSDKRIVEEFSSALNKLTDRYKDKIHFLFFPFSKSASSSDEEFMHSVINNLKYKEKATIVSHTNPIAWYRAIKELTDVFIGMRYHSIIFSFKAAKPFLSIPYERKVVEFLRDYNRKDCATVFPHEISESHIVDFIQRCQEKKDQKQEAAPI
jgi:polysaccharide pyruvyl transferase WcaK-like protein